MNKTIAQEIKRLGGKLLSAPKNRTDVSPLALSSKSAAYEFIFHVEWPNGVTFKTGSPDDDFDAWMVDFNYQPLELLGNDFRDFLGNRKLQMIGIYDGGNYILAVDPKDNSDDPKVLVIDHDDDGDDSPEKIKLSKLLKSLTIDENDAP